MGKNVLIGEAEIQKRVKALAVEIRRDHGASASIHLVAVLKGAFMFLSDLMREMDGEVTCDFIALSSYGSGTQSSGEVRLLKDLDRGLEGRPLAGVALGPDDAGAGLERGRPREVGRAVVGDHDVRHVLDRAEPGHGRGHPICLVPRGHDGHDAERRGARPGAHGGDGMSSSAPSFCP